MSVEHLDPSGTAKPRTVIVGAGGFVGGAIADALDAAGVETVRLGRREVDLLSEGAANLLAAHLKDGDAVVLVSAMAPCKTYNMMVDNLKIMEVMLDAVNRITPSYVLYVSSDAVYTDSDAPLTGDSVTAPDNPHGAMHAAREIMVKTGLGDTPVGILRPTLVYGAKDPHGGYGPNRFRALAQKGEEIVLFGKGEERRDHVSVKDVGELGKRMVMHKTVGALNAATGEVISFMDLAKLCSDLAGGGVAVRETERSGPMPHNGYRPFDPSGVKAAFPDFAFTAPRDGVTAMYRETEG